tara:strand:+ start:3366 stop:3809 length:444 start_codon:yes stop_codon:yes gene_type:complete
LVFFILREEKMDSTIQLFEFMGVNRSLFVQWVLIGTLTSLVVVYVAHTFRSLPMPARAGAMVSSIIGIISIFIYSATIQNIFIDQLGALQTLANSGSESAKAFLVDNEIALTGEIKPPFFMSILPLAQVAINLVLTVYLFLFAKWEK